MRARALVCAALFRGTIAIAEEPPRAIVECHQEKAALKLTAPARAHLAWSTISSTGASEAGAGEVLAVTRGGKGWLITLKGHAPRKLPRVDDHLFVVESEGGHFDLYFGKSEGEGWGGCVVDAEKLGALVPPPSPPPCTPAEVKKTWVPEVKRWFDAGDPTERALALCQSQSARVEADKALDIAIVDLMTSLQANASSSSAQPAILSVPAVARGLRADCEKLLHGADTCHNLQCIEVDTRIAVHCANATAKMIAAMK